MNMSEVIQGHGPAGIAYSVGLCTASGAIGGALGAWALTNLTNFTTSDGPMIGAAAAGAFIVTFFALSILMPGSEKDKFLSRLPLLAWGSTTIILLHKSGVNDLVTNVGFLMTSGAVSALVFVGVAKGMLFAFGNNPSREEATA